MFLNTLLLRLLLLGIFFVDERRNNIGPSRRPPHTDRRAVNRTTEQASRNCGKDRTARVGCLINNGGKIQTVKQDQRNREHRNKREGFERIGTVKHEKRDHQHRDIDDERQNSNTDPKQILYHRGNSVDSRRRKSVRENEDLVDKRRGDGNQDKQQILHGGRTEKFSDE